MSIFKMAAPSWVFRNGLSLTKFLREARPPFVKQRLFAIPYSSIGLNHDAQNKGCQLKLINLEDNLGVDFHSVRLMSTNGRITEEILKKRMSEPQKEEEKSKENDDKSNSWFSKKNSWKLGLIGLGAMSILMTGNLIVLWGLPSYDDDGNEIIDDYSHMPKWKAYINRAFNETKMFYQSMRDPSSRKLLPDPLKEPYYQPPYTLVIELTGVLVHPDWTLGTGWRFKKRPAIDYFLEHVSPPLFEIVIYTKESVFTALPIIEGIDSKGFVAHRLFRDATRYKDGHHIKDLDHLNRDLSKVIIVDCDPNAFKLHPRNAVGLPKWTGSDGDRKLIDLAHFLKTIAISNVDDVRTVIDHYNQFDDPVEAFRENQQRLKMEEDRRRQAESNSKSALLSGIRKR